MGCFCSKQANGRIFNEMFEISGPTLISQLHENTTSLVRQIYNHSPNELKIITDLTEDIQGVIWLHQLRELQLIPIEGSKKIFVFEREGIAIRVDANEGDAIFVMPSGTTPDVVRIHQGCDLSINKIRILLESVALRSTARERWRRQFLPISLVTRMWGPDHELSPEDE